MPEPIPPALHRRQPARAAGTTLAALAVAAFCVSLPLPALDANVMGVWGRVQTYTTASVLSFHLLASPWHLLAGDLPRAGLLPATLVFIAIPLLRIFKATRARPAARVLSFRLLVPWAFVSKIEANGGVARPGLYLLTTSHTLMLPATWCWHRAARVPPHAAHLTGRCRACGYDLRSTPDRCPECGADAAGVYSAGRT